MLFAYTAAGLVVASVRLYLHDVHDVKPELVFATIVVDTVLWPLVAVVMLLEFLTAARA